MYNQKFRKERNLKILEVHMPIYNKIGKTYDVTRRADPKIVLRLVEHLNPQKEGSYLDIGCGSGNYTHGVHSLDINITGIDISEEMLTKAREKNNRIDWVHGDAKKMPFSSYTFDGAICVLATHHIKDLTAAFQEAFRVIKKGNFVIFTAFPEQMQQYWLRHYFPKLMKKAQGIMVNYEDIAELLSSVGFQDIKSDKYFVTNELEDWFLHAGKYRPHIYLDPQVRAGISTFALEEDQNEISLGLLKLQNDIQTGEINKVIASYENTLGDYSFVVATKK
jgi:ubiquinone/menaquinone biosynthesis C-methylase UbiE